MGPGRRVLSTAALLHALVGECWSRGPPPQGFQTKCSSCEGKFSQPGGPRSSSGRCIQIIAGCVLPLQGPVRNRDRFKVLTAAAAYAIIKSDGQGGQCVAASAAPSVADMQRRHRRPQNSRRSWLGSFQRGPGTRTVRGDGFLAAPRPQTSLGCSTVPALPSVRTRCNHFCGKGATGGAKS